MTDEVKELKPLNKKQQVFVNEYLKCWNATEAARKAGYKNNDMLHTNASKLLQDTTIKFHIASRLSEIQMTADEAIKRLSEMARGDIGDFIEITSMGYSINLAKAKEQGKTFLMKKLKQKTITINGKDEDKEIHTEELELHDPRASLVDILKILGKYKDNVEHSGEIKTDLQVDDERFNRAIASLADALREGIPSKASGKKS